MNRKRREKKAANKARRKRGKEAVLVEIEKAFDESRRYYSKLWSKDAAYFAENGHYDWMASFVSGQRFVLEVGTGEASGTLALIKGGAVVVSVDENPLCLDQAEQKLRDQGVSVSAERRSRFVNVAGKWPVAYDPPNATAPEEGVVLLEGGIGNVGVDPELHNWLRSVDPFDAIVCWNIGTHQLRFEEIGDIAKYRLIVQNRVYEIADEILRPGGILHIVDRGRVASSNEFEWLTSELRAAHLDQASVTDLAVEAVDFRPYDLPESGTGIPLLFGGSSGATIGDMQAVLWSVVARKPTAE